MKRILLKLVPAIKWFRKGTTEEKIDGIPFYVKLLGKTIPILNTEGNLATGEITKFKFVQSCKNQFGFNKQVVGLEDGYDMIWRHISDDYFKCIGKWPERSC